MLYSKRSSLIPHKLNYITFQWRSQDFKDGGAVEERMKARRRRKFFYTSYIAVRDF